MQPGVPMYVTKLKRLAACLAVFFLTPNAQARAAEARVWPQILVLEHFALFAARSAEIKEYPSFGAADLMPTLRKVEGLLEQLPEEPWLDDTMKAALATHGERLVK